MMFGFDGAAIGTIPVSRFHPVPELGENLNDF